MPPRLQQAPSVEVLQERFDAFVAFTENLPPDALAAERRLRAADAYYDGLQRLDDAPEAACAELRNRLAERDTAAALELFDALPADHDDGGRCAWALAERASGVTAGPAPEYLVPIAERLLRLRPAVCFAPWTAHRVVRPLAANDALRQIDRLLAAASTPAAERWLKYERLQHTLNDASFFTLSQQARKQAAVEAAYADFGRLAPPREWAAMADFLMLQRGSTPMVDDRLKRSTDMLALVEQWPGTAAAGRAADDAVQMLRFDVELRDEAEARLRRLVEQQPKVTDYSRLWLSTTALFLRPPRQAERALALAREFAERWPERAEDPALLTLVGDAQSVTGTEPAALEAYRAAMANRDRFASMEAAVAAWRAGEQLADHYEQTGDLRGAIEVRQSMRPANPCGNAAAAMAFDNTRKIVDLALRAGLPKVADDTILSVIGADYLLFGSGRPALSVVMDHFRGRGDVLRERLDASRRTGAERDALELGIAADEAAAAGDIASVYRLLTRAYLTPGEPRLLLPFLIDSVAAVDAPGADRLKQAFAATPHQTTARERTAALVAALTALPAEVAVPPLVAVLTADDTGWWGIDRNATRAAVLAYGAAAEQPLRTLQENAAPEVAAACGELLALLDGGADGP